MIKFLLIITLSINALAHKQLDELGLKNKTLVISSSTNTTEIVSDIENITVIKYSHTGASLLINGKLSFRITDDLYNKIKILKLGK